MRLVSGENGAVNGPVNLTGSRVAPPPPRASMPQRRRLAYMAVVALGLALPLLLVWSVRYPPQVDAPNHVARHYLESLYLRGEPLPPGYEIAYRILPNLAADLVLPPLMVVFDPVAAWKIFLSLALMLYWAGPAVFILQEGGYRPLGWRRPCCFRSC